ncbi:MAG: hydantoinase B/oxoprolinase family protein [Thaumarchaeota archaeon]|jgi:N-methylhydantoinase B|nr:hydantoinase B/oxoprolinase family protein [Candidatus Geocrenenecus arthurdayi]MCL7391632.1 hydantoinase B/oxoprolinase family protein [Candidatus Geocrenenecus arthurdayi]MCL7403063.1 hydantoinase B/oxoprolinase family protein [Candidatus Geocrenenecus arthurdayi]
MSKVDIFTLEIIKNGLITANEEMFYAFGRTAKSPVIYEVLDYAVGITDSKGELIAQAPGVPGFSGVLDFVAKEVLEKWSGEMQPGDIYILNVPYKSGTHLNDVTLAMPVFYKDELISMILNKGHWSEVGGMHFGSWTSDSTEIYQEGVQFPCVRLYREGKPNKDVIDIILENSRLPLHTLGDMEAQAASMKVAARRIEKLIEKYGIESVKEAMEKIIDDGYKLALLNLKKLPKGVFEAEDYLDDDGLTDEPVYVRVKVTITDEEFIADFTGSGSVKGSIASPYPATVSGVRETYMAVTDPHVHLNGGYFKPLKVIAPPGSAFNPVKPSPTSTFWEAMSYATDLVWKALAPHVPDKLTAGHFLSILATILGGVDDRTGEPFAIVEPQAGGWGAGYDMDGESGLVACGDGETYIASNEVYEKHMPILVERYCLNVESGTGHGKFRGGFGVIKDYRVLCSEASFTVSIGRNKFPPWGVAGGMNGTPNYCVIYKQGEEPKIVRKVAAVKLRKGDMVSLRSGGGGGWGDPLERDPELVRMDVKNEYITIDIARNIYGVVLDPATLEIKWNETKKLREELKKKKKP